MIVIYDLETLKDFFLYCDVNATGEGDTFNVFSISKFRNDLIPLVKHLTTLKGQIGFNNVAFDAQIQQYIIKNHKKWLKLSGLEVVTIIYDYVAYVINKANSNEWLDFRESDFSIKQVDLFKVWHFNNKAKMTSLKWVQYMTDWHNIEDMPIHHSESVKDEDTADMVIDYCKNDCLSTRHFYNITRGLTSNSLYKGIDRLQLRKDVRAEFGFDCTNHDDVKIGDQINKSNYLKATGIDWKELKELRAPYNSFTFEDCFPSYIEFVSKPFNDFINSIKRIIINKEKGEQTFTFKFGSTSYVMAKGGLHSEDKPRLIIPTVNQIMRDADVGSMYPNAISKRKLYPRHLGSKWLDGYDYVIGLRMDAKKKFKETKQPKYQSIQEAFKLALNGGSFGKTNEKTSWQYDPFITFCVTIGCQIDLLMLIEGFELNGIKVISANTDGVVCLFDKDQEETYNKVCAEWEVKVGNDKMGKLEYADYSVLSQRSVNDYIAIKSDGSVKHKGGSFTINHELHKNKSYNIIALALDAYYSKGLNPRTFITQHENIFDFCAGMRTKGEWYLEATSMNGGVVKKEKLQKTNRYFICNKGVKLVKCHPDGRMIQEDAGKWVATVYNKHVQKNIKDYDINYDFYVKKAYEIISEIEPEIINENMEQLSLF